MKRLTRSSKQHNPQSDQQTDPKSLLPSDKELLRQSREQVPVRQKDGTTRTMSLEQVVTKKHLETALSGSPHALNQVTKHKKEAEQKEADLIAREIEEGKEQLAIRELLLEDFKKKQRDAGLEEKEIGKKAIDFYPHPEDIKIHAKGYTTNGPFDEDSFKQVQYLIKVRDAFILQDALDQRYPAPECTLNLQRHDDENFLVCGMIVPEELFDLRSSGLLYNMLNERLPERYQISTVDYCHCLWRHERLTKRELLKRCYQTWQELGLHRTRGWLTPPFYIGLRSQLRFESILSEAIKDTTRDDQSSVLEWIDTIKNVYHEVDDMVFQASV